MCYTLKPLSRFLIDLTCRLGRKFKLQTYRYGKVLSVPGLVFLFVFVTKYEGCKRECQLDLIYIL